MVGYIYKMEIGPYFYYGSSFNTTKRFYHHLNSLQNNRHCNPFIQRVFNKYGFCNFRIVEYGNWSETQMLDHEQFWIDFGLSNTQNLCMNINRFSTGGPIRGRTFTPEMRKKWSEAKKGIRFTEQHKQALSDASTVKRSVVLVVDGVENKFDSLSSAAKYIDIPISTLKCWLKKQHPWPGSGKRCSKKHQRLAGLKGFYVDCEEEKVE